MQYSLINPINDKYTVQEQILVNRGIAYKDIHHYLNTTERDNLPPLLLQNMDKGIALLMKHLKNPNSHIYVQVDSDCDGYTSSALLLNYLHEWVPSIVESKFEYGLHTGKQHGIDPEDIPPWVDLIIAPDSSSDQGDIHTQLHEKGIDVLVLDHHEADNNSEFACIINNQLCDYPTKSLSGVGIVYKFCQRIDELIGLHLADHYLDLVALGLIADMIDLRDFETHYLIERGLTVSRNPFINTMIEKNAYSIGNTVTPIGIAFYVAPFVNAMNRSGTQEEKELLFQSMLDWKAYSIIPSTKRGCAGQTETLVDQAVRTCANVKARQTKAQDALVEKLESYIAENDLLAKKVLLITVDEIERNLAGLCANKFMAKYQRPTAILQKIDKDGEISWEGSARGYGNCELTDFREFCRESNLVMYAQGHAQAFGLGIEDNNLQAFIDYTEDKLKNIDFTPTYKVDFIYQNSNLNYSDIFDIGSMKNLWGQNIGEALIAIEGIKITKGNITLMSKDKNPTLKITLPNDITAIKFKSSEEEFNNLFSESGCVVIDAVCKCDLNSWNGKVTPQLRIENYEIVNKQEYYF